MLKEVVAVIALLVAISGELCLSFSLFSCFSGRRSTSQSCLSVITFQFSVSFFIITNMTAGDHCNRFTSNLQQLVSEECYYT